MLGEAAVEPSHDGAHRGPAGAPESAFGGYRVLDVVPQRYEGTSGEGRGEFAVESAVHCGHRDIACAGEHRQFDRFQLRRQRFRVSVDLDEPSSAGSTSGNVVVGGSSCIYAGERSDFDSVRGVQRVHQSLLLPSRLH